MNSSSSSSSAVKAQDPLDAAQDPLDTAQDLLVRMVERARRAMAILERSTQIVGEVGRSGWVAPPVMGSGQDEDEDTAEDELANVEDEADAEAAVREGAMDVDGALGMQAPAASGGVGAVSANGSARPEAVRALDREAAKLSRELQEVSAGYMRDLARVQQILGEGIDRVNTGVSSQYSAYGARIRADVAEMQLRSVQGDIPKHTA